VYAPDLRGHGKSGWVAGAYRLQDYTADLVAFAQQRLKEPAHLVGHSLGGMIALMVAAQCPGSIRSVVVADSPLTSATWRALLQRDRQWLIALPDLAGGVYSVEHICQALKDAPLQVPGRSAPVPMREALGEDAPYFPWMADNLFQHDPRMLTALLEDFAMVVAGYEMETLLPQIGCPVLLLQADPGCGGVMTDTEVQRASALLAQPSHIRLTGISHALYHEQKDPVLDAIVRFLDND
jgi:pimeloyl-ACP methyl ester carboxylesterase